MLGYEHGLPTKNVIARTMQQHFEPIRYFAVLARHAGLDVVEYSAVVAVGAVLLDPREKLPSCLSDVGDAPVTGA